MAAFDDLLKQVSDAGLRARLGAEFARATKGRKFGLVYEDHLPEASPMYGMEIRPGMKVATRAQDRGAIFVVESVKNGKARCVPFAGDGKPTEFPLAELVAVTAFGEPIYPYLEKIDEIEHGGGDLWHTLIQADNYHALQLLEYLYSGQVDCIYIDPPYNTGAKDWKYNNDYVDGQDAWRHSKWLSMMEKRLAIAKRLLNPKDSVLIVTIDEKEYLHIGMLLEQMFPDAHMQMISVVIKPEGTQRRNEFSRTNEFIYFVMIGNAIVPTYTSSLFETKELEENISVKEIEWSDLRRRNRANVRASRPNQFYPIFVNRESGFIHSIGDALPLEQSRDTIVVPEGCYAVFPVAPDGREMLWGKYYKKAQEMLLKGIIKTENGIDPKRVHIKYLPEGIEEDLDNGKIRVVSRGLQNEIIGEYIDTTKYFCPKTIWNRSSHNAQTYGSLLIKEILGDGRFSFPKSLYAVKDSIGIFCASKPNALILDFFAGSGTTLHAVNLLNAEDGGKRRCILVTNNEVSADEAKEFTKKGLKPGDEKWEKFGIARYVTWPRTTCSIQGVNVKGEPLKGEYLGPGVPDTARDGECVLPGMGDGHAGRAPLPMAAGFKANAAFFKLGFTRREMVENVLNFPEMLSVLWMKSGAVGKCPQIDPDDEPEMLVLPENGFAVLLDTAAFVDFRKAVNKDKRIRDLYFVDGDEEAYAEMACRFKGRNTYQLFGDYVNHFRISARRNG